MWALHWKIISHLFFVYDSIFYKGSRGGWSLAQTTPSDTVYPEQVVSVSQGTKGCNFIFSVLKVHFQLELLCRNLFIYI